MFEVPITGSGDLRVFAHEGTIGVLFKGPTGQDDERHEVDLTSTQVLDLLTEFRQVRGRPAPIVRRYPLNDYPRPNYDDLIPPTLKSPYGGERKSGAVSSDECCGGDCCA